MCHFITLVVPSDDIAALRAVMERHGRRAEPIDNPSIRKVLREGERQYLTTRGHCDCGTVLAPRHGSQDDFEEQLARQASRLSQKDWSEAKVARFLEDRRKADAKPDGGGCDSLEMWHAALGDLRRDLNLPHAGLFVRFYAGAIATEDFKATRRQVSRSTAWPDALGSMEHDEVTIFPLTEGLRSSRRGQPE
jgi:hypothetical protein